MKRIITSLLRALQEFFRDKDQMQASWFSCGLVIMMAIAILGGVVLLPLLLKVFDYLRHH